jgi:hypothetical protein
MSDWYAGIKDGYSPDSVMIARAYFVRERFEFRAYIK